MKSILPAKVLSFQYDNDLDFSVPENMKLLDSIIINPLMPGGNIKDTHTWTNLVCLSMCDLFVTTTH